MDTLETVITLIFLPTAIVGGIVFVLRKFFEQILSRDIENYGNYPFTVGMGVLQF